MNQIQTIKSKLENLIKEWHLGSSAEAKYRCEAYKELLEYIDNLQEESVSEDLEEAAAGYAKEQLRNPDYPTYNDEYEIECAFEAGAQWQALHSLETIKGMEEQAFLAGVEAEQINKSFSKEELEELLNRWINKI